MVPSSAEGKDLIVQWIMRRQGPQLPPKLFRLR